MIRKVIRKVAIVLGAAATIGGAIPSVAANAQPAFTYSVWCANKGGDTSECMRLVNDSTAGGTAILGSASSTANSEKWDELQISNACGSGVVTNDCPFVNGSGLNTTYEGKPIVEFKNFNANCVGLDSSNNAVGKVASDCASGTTVWVEDGFSFVNAANSTGASHVIFLTSVLPQNSNVIGHNGFIEANSQWAPKS
jgi:hypothetical protein